MSFRDPPWLSVMTPMQLFLWTARGLGLGSQAMGLAIKGMTSRAAKIKPFVGYEPKAHDVFVTCLSKSGTNWMMQLVTQICHRGAAEFEHIHQEVPWPESKFPGIVGLEDMGPVTRSAIGKRGIKTTIHAEDMPYSPVASYVTVLRDPKDVLVSAYDFVMGIFGLREHIDMPTWIEMMLRPGGMIAGDWPAHTAGFWRLRDRPNVLVLEFADMKRSLDEAVDGIAALLDVELTQDERAKVIERGGFEYMKAHEEQFAPPRLRLLTGRERGKMMRAGKVGRSKQMLSDEQRARIDALMLERLEQLGSDFPYRERFMPPV